MIDGALAGGRDFSAAERRAYARDGYVVRVGEFAAAELEASRALVERIIAGVVERAERHGARPRWRWRTGTGYSSPARSHFHRGNDPCKGSRTEDLPCAGRLLTGSPSACA